MKLADGVAAPGRLILFSEVDDDMAFKVNHSFERLQRERAKQAKKEAKLRDRAARKAGALAGDAPAEGEVQDEADQALPVDTAAETTIVKE